MFILSTLYGPVPIISVSTTEVSMMLKYGYESIPVSYTHLHILLAVVMLFATLTACGNGGDGGAGGKHLNFACYNYSDSLDPITNVNSSWCGTRYGITECLFRFSDDVTAEPNICESYKVSDDYTTVSYTHLPCQAACGILFQLALFSFQPPANCVLCKTDKRLITL